MNYQKNLINDITPEKVISKSQPKANTSLDFGLGTKSFEFSPKPKKKMPEVMHLAVLA